MSSVNNVVKSLACGAAALVITLTTSAGVVQSTATYHWSLAAAGSHPVVVKLAVQSPHAWFGQPSPAVLVD